MSAQIRLTPGLPPGEQIGAQLRGLIATGALGRGERLPSVRQLASDLGVAAGTVAKVYRALEEEGLLLTRIGAGTRVSPDAGGAPQDVLQAARLLASQSMRAGLSLDDASRILGAVWPS